MHARQLINACKGGDGAWCMSHMHARQIIYAGTVVYVMGCVQVEAWLS